MMEAYLSINKTHTHSPVRVYMQLAAFQLLTDQPVRTSTVRIKAQMKD